MLGTVTNRVPGLTVARKNCHIWNVDQTSGFACFYCPDCSQTVYLGLRVLRHEPVEDVVEDDDVGGGDQLRHSRQLHALRRHAVAEAELLNRRLADLWLDQIYDHH